MIFQEWGVPAHAGIVVSGSGCSASVVLAPVFVACSLHVCKKSVTVNSESHKNVFNGKAAAIKVLAIYLFHSAVHHIL